MEPVNDNSAQSNENGRVTKKHIRGSSLLLVGRLIAILLNCVVQVLVVRYLTKADYGAFSYAIALIAIGTSLTGFGLHKALTRFIPIYEERGEFHKVSGTLVVVFGTVLGLGLASILLVFGIQGLLERHVVSNPQSVVLLLILVALVPVQAIGNLVEKAFAIFASPKAIFFRRHILGPGLKLCSVMALIAMESNVLFLAGAYLLSGLVSLVISWVMLVRILRNGEQLRQFSFRNMSFPAREIFGFSIPLLSSDLVFLLRASLVIFLVEFLVGTKGVAEFQAVMPIARLNGFVFESFKLLFVPLAARMFAKGDMSGIFDLYWRTATWIAILSFPIFAVTFAFAQPVTVLLFGDRYVNSGIILAVLSLARFLDVSFGLNALTLRVFGKVRQIFQINCVLIVAGVALNLVLIPRYGALGGALASFITVVAQNVFYQCVLCRVGGTKPVDLRFLKVAVVITLTTVGLVFVQWTFTPPIYVGLLLAAFASLLVLVVNVDALKVQDMFPELTRFRSVKDLVGLRTS